ncbi:hypothetical protein PCANC_27934 [Puccinia coronata f. sp. avenae]|uniref:Uncharacterized protein n=1 Tax=Puccinia coronata f. sp. avenae TaxID=200324 RepID=A0A2N5TPR1_9BASI|nr:hypothetical protein PCANC_27934 [Puccinia coronata f. sp. avenae]
MISTLSSRTILSCFLLLLYLSHGMAQALIPLERRADRNNSNAAFTRKRIEYSRPLPHSETRLNGLISNDISADRFLEPQLIYPLANTASSLACG